MERREAVDVSPKGVLEVRYTAILVELGLEKNLIYTYTTSQNTQGKKSTSQSYWAEAASRHPVSTQEKFSSLSRCR